MISRTVLTIGIILGCIAGVGSALPAAQANHMHALGLAVDADQDGLSTADERAYGTDPAQSDTDGDGYLDGDEIGHGYDPMASGSARLPKRITVDISEQTLRYGYGIHGVQESFAVSTAAKGYRTPTGTFTVMAKLPLVHYKGRGYDYPRTKWNLRFFPQYYIHGAWWHNDFGTPRSHGCVNAPYPAMELLYAFADVGTEVVIVP